MRSMILSAGKSCFVACPGCYNHFARTLASTDDLLGFVRAYQERFGLSRITVGGGDPLTRPDLLTLLTGLKDRGLSISLDTVGTAFLGDARIRFMGEGIAAHVPADQVAALTHMIGIPLDGTTDAVQQLFRRHARVEEQRAVLRTLHSAGARVCVNTVVHAGNAGAIGALAGLLAEHACVVEWQLFQFMPIGPLGHRNRERFLIDDSAFVEAADAARAASPSTVNVIAKSAQARKHRYLLIDAGGQVWIPSQSTATAWSPTDSSGERVTLGPVQDPKTLQRIADYVNEPAGAAQ
ncbi:radical SAM protein [Streptacidiphilus cavernicola]|uniref:Radical SAM protein n=1 Tax=Streptacidiphilus cavernicola TaxID=3342716 RepID=A0ABV6VWD3_9ACTN